MRAKDIMIQIPITIHADGNVSVPGQEQTQDLTPVLPEPNEPPVEPPKSTDNKSSTDNLSPGMVYPQDQKLELQKAALGKKSKVIDRLLQNDDE